MVLKKAFKRGGVNTWLRVPYKSSPIENAFLPLNAVVILRESESLEEAIPIVSIGQEVRDGQLLARSSGRNSVNVHSPIPGIIRRIGQLKMPGGFLSTAIVISLEGSFCLLGRKPNRHLWKSLNKIDILHIIQDKGVVNISDSKPLYDILSDSMHSESMPLVISALEMDAYRRIETELLSLKTESLVDGIAIISRIVSPEKIILVVDETCPKTVIAKLDSVVASVDYSLSVEYVKRRYPQDMKAQIAEALGFPPDKNFLKLEPSTIIAVHEAVVFNRPHIEQYVHVCGGAVKKPAILKARIGSPIGDLIEECGGLVGKPDSIVIGDPFKEWSATDLDVSVTRSIRCVLALTKEETKRAKELPCSRCGDCVEACPIGLQPYRLLKLVKAGRKTEALSEGLSKCSFCGTCAYVCLSRIPLMEIFNSVINSKEGE